MSITPNWAVSFISLISSLDSFSVTENPLYIILWRFLIANVETSGRKIIWKVSNGDDSRLLRLGLNTARRYLLVCISSLSPEIIATSLGIFFIYCRALLIFSPWTPLPGWKIGITLNVVLFETDQVLYLHIWQHSEVTSSLTLF